MSGRKRFLIVSTPLPSNEGRDDLLSSPSASYEDVSTPLPSNEGRDTLINEIMDNADKMFQHLYLLMKVVTRETVILPRMDF